MIVNYLKLLLLLLTTHCSSKLPGANTATHALSPSQSIKVSLFKTSQTPHIFLNSFLTLFYHNIRGRPGFCLALDGSQTRTIFDNMSFFSCRTCSSHLNLSLIIALECGIEPNFSYSLLLGGDLKLVISRQYYNF